MFPDACRSLSTTMSPSATSTSTTLRQSGRAARYKADACLRPSRLSAAPGTGIVIDHVGCQVPVDGLEVSLSEQFLDERGNELLVGGDVVIAHEVSL